MLSFVMVWLHLLCLALSPIVALGLAMMGFTFLSSFLDKRTYNIVHRCNGGNALAPSSLLISKKSENKIPLVQYVHLSALHSTATWRHPGLSFVNETYQGFTKHQTPKAGYRVGGTPT
jgi:hypothetical protein